MELTFHLLGQVPVRDAERIARLFSRYQAALSGGTAYASARRFWLAASEPLVRLLDGMSLPEPYTFVLPIEELGSSERAVIMGSLVELAAIFTDVATRYYLGTLQYALRRGQVREAAQLAGWEDFTLGNDPNAVGAIVGPLAAIPEGWAAS